MLSGVHEGGLELAAWIRVKDDRVNSKALVLVKQSRNQVINWLNHWVNKIGGEINDRSRELSFQKLDKHTALVILLFFFFEQMK